MTCVLQAWVQNLPMMQQSVLFSAVRGPDGLPKYHPSKYLLRWYRRCILISAMDKKIYTNPIEQGGGSFTGPSTGLDQGLDPSDWQDMMNEWVRLYIQALDEIPHHYQMHFMHAVEIVGYQHPDDQIGSWWHQVYCRLVHDLHLWPESKEEMNKRLGDNEEDWKDRSDSVTHH